MAKRIMNKWRGYTVADCDCKYCLYYGGRKNREVNCLADECVCKAEKINREIRNYTESMFFGLSFRQFVFSLLAVGVAIVLYFALKPHVGTETVSWMCILGAAPFAAMGFISYNGMTAEQFVWAWLRSEMIEPKQIKFEPVNIYYEALKDTIDAKEKEVYKGND